MFIFPTSAFFEAEIVQLDRWKHGPLELVFVDDLHLSGQESIGIIGTVANWNLSYRGGFARSGWKEIFKLVPAIKRSRNPNVVIVPRHKGFTELHTMLASVVPNTILKGHGIEKHRANFVLWPSTTLESLADPKAYAKSAAQAFEQYIWDKLAPRKRLNSGFFAKDSPLRLLAGDSAFWMHRLYRVAMDIAEYFEQATDDPNWKPLEAFERNLYAQIPEHERASYQVVRPRKGGRLWEPDDEQTCGEIVNEVVHGGETLESLDPVLDVLHSDKTHEDFSEKWSPVKEDFERSFYSKRAKIKVSFIETVDNCPVWSAGEPLGERDVIFRDLLSFFNRKERHIILAVRSGKTVSEIAQDLGLEGHAVVSRKLRAIKLRLAKLLRQQS